MLNTECYSRVGWGESGCALEFYVLVPQCAPVCFWNQALEELCINIAFLLPVLGGPYMDISTNHRILSTFYKNNLILFIISNITSFFPSPLVISQSFCISKSRPPTRTGRGLGKGTPQPPPNPCPNWGNSLVNTCLGRRGRRWVLGRRPWHYGAVRAHNGD